MHIFSKYSILLLLYIIIIILYILYIYILSVYMVSHIYFSSKFICKLMIQILLQVRFNSLQHAHYWTRHSGWNGMWKYILPRRLIILPSWKEKTRHGIMIKSHRKGVWTIQTMNKSVEPKPHIDWKRIFAVMLRSEDASVNPCKKGKQNSVARGVKGKIT